MNTARTSTIRGILGVLAVTALMFGGTAAARGFGGSSYHGSMHGRSGPGLAAFNRGAPYFRGDPFWSARRGAILTVLPDYYTTLWFGGIPYYFADGIYYAWQADADGYAVTTPPPGVQPDSTAGSTAPFMEPFVYPSKGQSEAQQASDRSECHRWAVDQSGSDPTRPASASQGPVSGQGRDGYLRALTACLEGRGYSVK